MHLSHPLLFIASQAGFSEEIGDLGVKFENEGEGEEEGVAGALGIWTIILFHASGGWSHGTRESDVLVEPIFELENQNVNQT